MIKNNKLLVLIGIVFAILGTFGKSLYRDYINSNGINDYGIAGFLPSYLLVISFSLMLLVKQTKDSKDPLLIFFFVALGSVIYEFIQVWVWERSLDLPDILASIGGGLTAALIYWLVQRYTISNEKWTN